MNLSEGQIKAQQLASTDGARLECSDIAAFPSLTSPSPGMLYVLSSRAGRRSWGTAHTAKEDFCPLFPGLDGCSPSCCLWAPAILQWLQSQPQSAVSDDLRLAQSTGKNIFEEIVFFSFEGSLQTTQNVSSFFFFSSWFLMHFYRDGVEIECCI